MFLVPFIDCSIKLVVLATRKWQICVYFYRFRSHIVLIAFTHFMCIFMCVFGSIYCLLNHILVVLVLVHKKIANCSLYLHRFRTRIIVDFVFNLMCICFFFYFSDKLKFFSQLSQLKGRYGTHHQQIIKTYLSYHNHIVYIVICVTREKLLFKFICFTKFSCGF